MGKEPRPGKYRCDIALYSGAILVFHYDSGVYTYWVRSGKGVDTPACGIERSHVRCLGYRKRQTLAANLRIIQGPVFVTVLWGGDYVGHCPLETFRTSLINLLNIVGDGYEEADYRTDAVLEKIGRESFSEINPPEIGPNKHPGTPDF